MTFGHRERKRTQAPCTRGRPLAPPPAIANAKVEPLTPPPPLHKCQQNGQDGGGRRLLH